MAQRARVRGLDALPAEGGFCEVLMHLPITALLAVALGRRRAGDSLAAELRDPAAGAG